MISTPVPRKSPLKPTTFCTDGRFLRQVLRKRHFKDRLRAFAKCPDDVAASAGIFKPGGGGRSVPGSLQSGDLTAKALGLPVRPDE